MIRKFQRLFLTAFIFLAGISFAQKKDSEFPVLKGPYLGQEPPGLIPEVFAPGIICGSDHEGCAEFTKNGSLFLFQRLSRTESNPADIPVFLMELKDGKWTEPGPAPFESPYMDWDYHFAPNGRTLYFTSKRPATVDGKSSLSSNIWMTEITPGGWTQPRLLQYPINTSESSEQTPSATSEGTLYFFSSRDGGYGKCDIYRAIGINGTHIQVENLGNVINTEHDEYDLFIAPDESYLIFSSDRPGGFGDVDLYVSYQKVDGAWTEPKNMGKNINSGGAVFPTVTEDGRFLFFQSRRGGNGDIYWVDAKIIEEMKQKNVLEDWSLFDDPECDETTAETWIETIYRSSVERTDEIKDPILKGAYLGQNPPGKTPEVFVPGIISTGADEGCSYFSKDGQFYLFARGGSVEPGIFIMEQKEGIWSKPYLASFSSGRHDWDFTLTPDGNTVFIASGRPHKKGGAPERDHSIWVSERTMEGWSKPQLLPFPVNSGQHDSYPSVTEDGTLYFFSRRSGGLGMGDIYRSWKTNGHYTTIENLGASINTEFHEVDPFISPDESYMILCSDRPGGYGKADIYISFRKEDGSWTEPVNLGEKVNTPYDEYIPAVTPDGKYFFFTSNKSGNREIYWVDAKMIIKLKSNQLKL